MNGSIAVFYIAAGLLMGGWWTNDLRRGAWNRDVRTHAELVAHLAAELVTAGWLVGLFTPGCFTS